MSTVDDKSNQDSRKGGARRGNTQSDRPAGQQRQNQNQSQTQNVARENSNTQGRKGGKTGPSVPAINKSLDATTTGQPTVPIPDGHIPLDDFNSTEIDTLLRRAVDPKIPIYKPETHVPQTKATSPWGAKPGSMSNGRDFFLELRKQVTNLRQSGGVSQGG